MFKTLCPGERYRGSIRGAQIDVGPASGKRNAVQRKTRVEIGCSRTGCIRIGPDHDIVAGTRYGGTLPVGAGIPGGRSRGGIPYDGLTERRGKKWAENQNCDSRNNGSEGARLRFVILDDRTLSGNPNRHKIPLSGTNSALFYKITVEPYRKTRNPSRTGPDPGKDFARDGSAGGASVTVGSELATES